MSTNESRRLSLICRVDSRLCALPLEHVIETMRPLPVEPVAGAPASVRGLAMIRGVPTPVVDLAHVLAAETSSTTRFVTVQAGSRAIALAVDAVVDVRDVPASSLRDLPPLFQGVNTDAIVAIGSLDADLLVVLDSVRLVPAPVWTALGLGDASS